MSKELSPLEALDIVKSGGVGYRIDDFNYALDIVEVAVKKSEKLDKLLISKHVRPDDFYDYLEEIQEGMKTFAKQYKVLEIIKEYTYSGGWSGDYTTEYWNMNQKEIKMVDELFKDVPIKPLSEALK